MADDELWDLRNADGTPVGRTHRRGDSSWPAGYFHLVAAVCVLHSDGRLLLTRRSANKDHPLKWEFPAGSALAGETGADAAVRELREETGLLALSRTMLFVGRFQERSALVDLFVTEVEDPDALSLQLDEVDAAQWVTAKEIEGFWSGGLMAASWELRLAALWRPLQRLLEERSSDVSR